MLSNSTPPVPTPVCAAREDRFYAGIGVDERRCAACAAYPSLPCADHRDAEGCTGEPGCRAGIHAHGCHADTGGTICNAPESHRVPAAAP